MNSREYKTLIIVAGHSVYVGKDFNDIYDDKNWFLFPFQKGEQRFYIEHIKAGFELTAKDENALLVFSGTQSRREAGPISEANGYWRVAESQNWFGFPDVRNRCITEEFARDSFENLYFSYLRFKQYNGDYPEKVYMVSWKFKETRFDLHRKAAGIADENYTYIGVNNPEDLDTAIKGEEKAVEEFRKDPFGNSESIQKKRDERNPFKLKSPF